MYYLMMCPGHVFFFFFFFFFFFLIVLKMSSPLVCSLIHDGLFLSPCYAKFTFSIPLCALWCLCSRALVRLLCSKPYVRTGRLFFITLCCLPKVFHAIPIFWFILHDLDMHQFPILCKCISGHVSVNSASNSLRAGKCHRILTQLIRK